MHGYVLYRDSQTALQFNWILSYVAVLMLHFISGFRFAVDVDRTLEEALPPWQAVPDIELVAVPDIELAVAPDMQLVGRLAVSRHVEQSPRRVVGRHPAVQLAAGERIPKSFAAGTTCKGGKYPRWKRSRKCNQRAVKTKRVIWAWAVNIWKWLGEGYGDILIAW